MQTPFPRPHRADRLSSDLAAAQAAAAEARGESHEFMRDLVETKVLLAEVQGERGRRGEGRGGKGRVSGGRGGEGRGGEGRGGSSTCFALPRQTYTHSLSPCAVLPHTLSLSLFLSSRAGEYMQVYQALKRALGNEKVREGAVHLCSLPTGRLAVKAIRVRPALFLSLPRSLANPTCLASSIH